MDDEIGHPAVTEDVGVEKKNSLGRSGAPPTSRFAGRKPVGIGRVSQDIKKRDSVGSLHSSDDSTRVGISLTDKPMID